MKLTPILAKDITRIVTVCPYCMVPVQNRTECCGESSAHFAQAYEVTGGTVYLYSECLVVPNKSLAERSFEVEVMGDTFRVFHEEGHIYAVQDPFGVIHDLSELTSEAQDTINKAMVQELASDLIDRSDVRPVQPTDIDPPGTYDSDYYKESK